MATTVLQATHKHCIDYKDIVKSSGIVLVAGGFGDVGGTANTHRTQTAGRTKT